MSNLSGLINYGLGLESNLLINLTRANVINRELCEENSELLAFCEEELATTSWS